MAGRRSRETTTIEMPAPTAWPMFLGLGVTLAFAGIVTHVYVTVAGAVVAMAAVIGWWRQVLPRQQVETFEVAVEAPPRPAPAPPLEPGRDRHRLRLPVEIHPYRAGVAGGLAGAVAMAVVAVAGGVIAYASPWYPINLLAAIAMPGLADAGPQELARFHAGAFLVASVVHLTASVLVGLLYTVILPMLPRRPLLLGGVISPLLWTGLLYSAMGVVNPTLDEQVSWTWFLVSQVAFGLAAGAVIARSTRIRTLQVVALADRAGLQRSAGRGP